MKVILIFFYFCYTCVCFGGRDYIFEPTAFSSLDGDGFDKSINCKKFEGDRVIDAANDVLTVFGFEAASTEQMDVKKYGTLQALMLNGFAGSPRVAACIFPDTPILFEFNIRKREKDKVGEESLRLSRFLLADNGEESNFLYKGLAGFFMGLRRNKEKDADGEKTNSIYRYKLSVLNVYTPLFECFTSIKYWHVVRVANCISNSFYINGEEVSADQLAVFVVNLAFVKMCSFLEIENIVFDWHIFKFGVKSDKGNNMRGDDFLKDMWGFVVYYLYRFSKNTAVAGGKYKMTECEKKGVLVEGKDSIKEKILGAVFDEFFKIWYDRIVVEESDAKKYCLNRVELRSVNDFIAPMGMFLMVKQTKLNSEHKNKTDSCCIDDSASSEEAKKYTTQKYW